MADAVGTGRALGVLQSNLQDIDAIQMNAGGKAGFYGVAPVAQRTGAIQASAGVAALTSGASTISVNVTLQAAVVEIMATLTALGLWRGS